MKLRKLAFSLFVLLWPGLVMAGWNEARTAYKSGDFKTAAKEMKVLAEKGDAKAQVNLGAMYADGQGVPQNYKMAIKWYLAAAKQGDTKAQVNLGEMYMNGQGVARDEVQALKWNMIAAAGGDRDGAQYRDALMRQLTGDEVKKARGMAQIWLTQNRPAGKR